MPRKHRKSVKASQGVSPQIPHRRNEPNGRKSLPSASGQAPRHRTSPAKPGAGVLLLCGAVVILAIALLGLRLIGTPSDSPTTSSPPIVDSIGSLVDSTRAMVDSAAGSAPGAEQKSAALAKPKKPNFLSTSGSKIVDADGREVRLTGVNWFGMETQTFSPHGLWARNWGDMLDQIVASGFNTIRLPFASTVLDPNAKPMEGIDYTLNPDLRGLNGLQIMDKIVEGAGERGLKIILDRHRPDSQSQSKLWYTDFMPETQWIADWQTLAKRYLGNDAVIGADLHNEPAGEAQWGGEPRVDWRAAAERAGNAIHEVNPEWLIVVEGIERVGNDGYWMGGNLSAAGRTPVNLKIANKVVYSAHDYGPGVWEQEWFKDKTFPANMPAIWDKHWGYLVKENIAPVLVGEFGGKSVSEKDREGIWQRELLKYLDANRISFTYWTFNPNSVDTGGILQDDWKAVRADKLQVLGPYLRPKLAVNTPNAIDRGAVARGERKNALPAQPIKVQFAAGQTDARTSEPSLKMLIVNQTAAHVPLPSVELRYWLSPADASLATIAKPAIRNGQKSVLGNLIAIDWASTDGVTAALAHDESSDRPYVKVTFDDNAGIVPSFGNVEVQVRLSKPDKAPFVQTDAFSYKPFNSPVENDQIALYFWGERVWGKEPQPETATAPKADVEPLDDATDPAVLGATAEGAGQRSYEVKPGDSLRSIADRLYGNEDAWPGIFAVNRERIDNPDVIAPGTKLSLP